MTDAPEPNARHTTDGVVADRNALYTRLHAEGDFQELRRRYRGFAIPWTVAFLSWYLLYVICSNWATDFMTTDIVGNINVALVFGLLQFVSTFFIAWMYSRHATKQLDPLAERIESEYERAAGPDAEVGR
jgi:uncharacterized membrane protein (DUF485 family)